MTGQYQILPQDKLSMKEIGDNVFKIRVAKLKMTKEYVSVPLEEIAIES
jgi:hypothetical protein